MSMRCSGAARRSFIIGSRLCPPAMMRASGPSLSSSATACSTLVARSYSNGAGTCTGNSFRCGACAGRSHATIGRSTSDEAIASLTLAQLQSFVTVARLGSVKAAARSLGVSEPAVSGAVGALRRELGDQLYVRSGGGLELTPGGQRLAAAGGEILGLAEQARR